MPDTLQSNLSLPSRYTTSEVTTVELADNTEAAAAEALPCVPSDEMEDWVYSATAETPAGEGQGLDLDLEPGFTAQWDSEIVKVVRATLEGFDLAEHAITAVPEATDTVQVIVTVNDMIALNSDEGLTAQDGETLPFEIDGVIRVAGGDVVRLAVISGGKFEASDWIAEDGAPFGLHPA